METLTETPFFKLLSVEGSLTDSNSLVTAYKEFTFAVITMSTGNFAEIPTFFTLNYTLFELTQLQRHYNHLKGDKKKCAHTCTH